MTVLALHSTQKCSITLSIAVSVEERYSKRDYRCCRLCRRMMWMFVATCLLLVSQLAQTASDISPNSNNALSDSVQYAHLILTQRTNSVHEVQRAKKLAVVIMLTFPVHPMTDNMSKRLDFLRCSLHNIKTHIAPWTPLDIFIWINETTKDHFPSWVAEEYPEVVLMPTPESSWVVPPGIIHDSKWVFRGVHSLGYYLMGRWRMTYAFDFVRAMGYSYMLQMDDDAFVVDDLDFNIVEYFREHDVYMGFRNNAHYDYIEVLTGLPELTATWFLSGIQNVSAAVPTLPAGPLFEQFAPTAHSFHEISTVKWLRRRHYLGAFMVFSIKFWYRDYVQSYLNFVLESGKDMSQRWQEQGVINLMRVLFVANEKFLLFDQNIIHSFDYEVASVNMLTSFGICPEYVFDKRESRQRDYIGCADDASTTGHWMSTERSHEYRIGENSADVSQIRFIIHFTHERISGHEGPKFYLTEFLWQRGLQCTVGGGDARLEFEGKKHFSSDNNNNQSNRNYVYSNEQSIVNISSLQQNECPLGEPYGLDGGLYASFEELMEKVRHVNQIGSMPAAFGLKIRSMAKKIYTAASNDMDRAAELKMRVPFLKLVYPSFQA